MQTIFKCWIFSLGVSSVILFANSEFCILHLKLLPRSTDSAEGESKPKKAEQGWVQCCIFRPAFWCKLKKTIFVLDYYANFLFFFSFLSFLPLKTLKFRFCPAFGVPSTQKMIKIYNSSIYSLLQNFPTHKTSLSFTNIFF